MQPRLSLASLLEAENLKLLGEQASRTGPTSQGGAALCFGLEAAPEKDPTPPHLPPLPTPMHIGTDEPVDRP